MVLLFFFFFFFFQAEDGIRDHCVTGVQTCALPISPPVDDEPRTDASADGEPSTTEGASATTTRTASGNRRRRRGGRGRGGGGGQGARTAVDVGDAADEIGRDTEGVAEASLETQRDDATPDAAGADATTADADAEEGTGSTASRSRSRNRRRRSGSSTAGGANAAADVQTSPD